MRFTYLPVLLSIFFFLFLEKWMRFSSPMYCPLPHSHYCLFAWLSVNFFLSYCNKLHVSRGAYYTSMLVHPFLHSCCLKHACRGPNDTCTILEDKHGPGMRATCLNVLFPIWIRVALNILSPYDESIMH